jgi:hypothetical protein
LEKQGCATDEAGINVAAERQTEKRGLTPFLISETMMNKWARRVLLLFEIGGGFAGLAVIAESFATVEVTAATVILNSIFGGVFLLGIIAGLALVEKPAVGLRLSLIYQALQIPMFISPAITYVLISGFMVSVFCEGAHGYFMFGGNFNFGSQFQFWLFQDVGWRIGINIVAVALLVAVVRAMRRQPESRVGQPIPEGSPSASPDEMSS